MGGTPTSVPATLSCLSIFVLLSTSSTSAFSHAHSPSRLLRTFSTGTLLVASSSTPSIDASNGLTAPQGGNDSNKLEQPSQTHLDRKAVLSIVGATLAAGCILLCLVLGCLLLKHACDNQSSMNRCQHPAEQTADQRSWSRALSSFRVAIKRDKGPSFSACAIDYALLKAATDNFCTNNLVGSGGFGRIYKARLDDGLFAAVKRLQQPPPLKHRLQRDFQTEVELMSKISHPNLVALLGYSIHEEDNNYLLVYEFMLNGSLEDQLHGPSRGSILNWNLRMKVALDAARGLENLHERCSPPIIHRDFKSSNILLDASFNAKVSDFGLAILSSNVAGDKTVELQGTFGYVAPEYLLDGILSEKSDVYAFGVVLLELLTGRKPIDMSMPIGFQSLVTWASPHLADRAKLMELLDPTLQKEHVELKHLQQVAAIAALCIQSEPSYRPLITDVVNSLVPLVPWELGGTMRGTVEPRVMTMTMLRAGQRSSVEPLPYATAKCLSFSEYSFDADTHERDARFSMSAWMA